MKTSVLSKSERRKNALEIAVTAAACVVSVAALAMSPGAEGTYGVLVRGGFTASDVITAAGGSVLSVSSGGTVALARSSNPAFIWHLYRNGAGLVFNPLFAAGCNR